VNLSGITRPVACFWRRSSPTAACGIYCGRDGRSGSIRFALLGGIAPDAREAIGLEFEKQPRADWQRRDCAAVSARTVRFDAEDFLKTWWPIS